MTALPPSPAYFQHFSKKPRDLYRDAPSFIRAIIVIPSPSTPTLVLVCWDGEILGLSSKDWETVEWRSKVKLPANQTVYIEHGVYDSITDELYFIGLKATMILPIYRVSYSSLISTSGNSSGKKIVELGILATDKEVDERRFDSLTIDSSNRLLYACDYYGSKHKDISIWVLTASQQVTGTTITAQLIGSIKTGYKPYFCTFYIRPPQRNLADNAIFYLAVSDLNGDRVDLMAADDRRYFDELRRRYDRAPSLRGGGGLFSSWKAPLFGGSRSNDQFAVFDVSGSQTPGPAILTRVAFIAEKGKKEKDKQLGTVGRPYELSFDTAGNLFVCEHHYSEGIDRVQAFTFVEDKLTAAIGDSYDDGISVKGSTMAGVWASNKIGPSATRLAVMPTNPPCLVTHGSTGAECIATFEIGGGGLRRLVKRLFPCF